MDIGWHEFLTDTQPYAEFCERIASRFIHHVPIDAPTDPTLTPAAVIGAW